jgi:hypothetical protein
MDLERFGGPDWQGWRLRNGRIWAPEWRNGVSPGEIRAVPYLYASQAEAQRMAREIQTLKKQLAAVARLAAWYRRQLTRESRLGLALSRIL